jgi:hypothetical protein
MESGTFKPELVAPCGMNCALCKNYLAYTHGVPEKKGKVSHCAGCILRGKNCFVKRGCKKLSKHQLESCGDCADLPCKSVQRLEKRYNERYGTSFVANLKEIKEKGITAFLTSQEEKSRCPSCGGVVSIHDKKCYYCGKTAA